MVKWGPAVCFGSICLRTRGFIDPANSLWGCSPNIEDTSFQQASHILKQVGEGSTYRVPAMAERLKHLCKSTCGFTSQIQRRIQSGRDP